MPDIAITFGSISPLTPPPSLNFIKQQKDTAKTAFAVFASIGMIEF